MDPFAFIPDDAILEIALVQTVESIFRLCLTSRRFNYLVCDNDYFWHLKFIHDYGEPENAASIFSWKTEYQNNYGRDVFAFGGNEYGQLGLGDDQDRYVPTQIPGIKARFVSCGDEYTMIIDSNDNVWGFGFNEDGELGLGDDLNKDIPTQIPNIRAKTISCGAAHTMIIDLENNLWAFGLNGDENLGLGNEADEKIYDPTQVANIKAKAVSCGSGHTVVIDLNNNLWSFGFNRNGELGLGDDQFRNIPTQITNIKAKAVSCGGGHTMIIDLTDNVWAFGENQSGQLGLGDVQPRFVPTSVNIKAKAISCGNYSTFIIDLNNEIWAFGYNGFGQLGLGDNQNRNIPTLVRLNSTTPNIKVKAVSCGYSHTMILDLSANVWAFGKNDCGQLGLGDRQDRLIPTQIPNIKAKSVSCGTGHTIIIGSLQHKTNIRVISFAEAAQKLNSGKFTSFNFLPEHQYVPHNPNNHIATFYGKDGNIYLIELRYDQTTNQIFPPV